MTYHEQATLSRALSTLAVVMRQQVPAEAIAVLVKDLSPYALREVLTALERHRKTSRFFPQPVEILEQLDSRYRVTPDRRRMPAHGDRYACWHVPKCQTITDCRDRILDDAAAERRAALVAKGRAS